MDVDGGKVNEYTVTGEVVTDNSTVSLAESTQFEDLDEGEQAFLQRAFSDGKGVSGTHTVKIGDTESAAFSPLSEGWHVITMEGVHVFVTVNYEGVSTKVNSDALERQFMWYFCAVVVLLLGVSSVSPFE